MAVPPRSSCLSSWFASTMRLALGRNGVYKKNGGKNNRGNNIITATTTTAAKTGRIYLLKKKKLCTPQIAAFFDWVSANG